MNQQDTWPRLPSFTDKQPDDLSHISDLSDPLLRRSVCAAGQPAWTQVSRCIAGCPRVTVSSRR